MNQDLDDGFRAVSAYLACLLRTSFGSLVIMENRDSCLRWSSAVAGKDPPKKYTNEAEVFGMSFCKFSIVSRKWWSIVAISDFVRTRLASPDRRTGVL